MRGFFFSKPLEFRLETPQESLVQGETIQGALTVTNRGGKSASPGMEVGLAYGNFKKIKKNDEDAFEPVERKVLNKAVTLAPNEEHQEEWSLLLSSDCPITSSEGALFLQYGKNLEEAGAWSKLDLQVAISPELKTFITTLENHFAFAEKSSQYKGGYTEATFKPPGSFPTLEELVLLLRMRDELELKFQCKMKKFGRGTGGGIKTSWVKLERTYPRKDFLINNGQPNRAFYRDVIESLLAEAAPPPIKK